jgi:hypothetical protein
MPSWKLIVLKIGKQIDAIVEETFDENMTIISGILLGCKCTLSVCNKRRERTVGEIFKNFNLFIYGGVNLEP